MEVRDEFDVLNPEYQTYIQNPETHGNVTRDSLVQGKLHLRIVNIGRESGLDLFCIEY